MIRINNDIEIRFGSIKPFKPVYSGIEDYIRRDIRNFLWRKVRRPIFTNGQLVRRNLKDETL